ncbi:phage shock protein operon transcriptional activator [Novosphingobium mangrovi (ex Huang et al. 2023)]|uniref:Phage shock protein operon transcriptional activator n=1 Tax=Novosphingobium mangrovi (ex Huang et al. 2023) TaxID=2976432 RepID=A0ABT2I227_9SPHN|nr:phage shock protein operon transcriptional activator [Novosphingobium mangrovi (ex Huang et al. 2023)]MCT2398849.1 phage shock protein operon transcriptional activator [Novosphingobium mangrovi (ex Huang et al. 2023)]
MDRDVQFIGQSTAFLDAVERASRAAPVRRPVLVIGERGTGKELIAQRLHRLSPRWGEPLVTLNCAALPETLIEAELFGHEAGAFTGATRARAGRFEEADKGTLFLDELGNLSMAAQERLLRAIEYGEVVRIGASRPVTVDVRIVAATNADLPRMAEEGAFRADLLDRLSFEVITLPPLRAREGDVHELADYYGRRMASELEWDGWPGFSEGALATLEAHTWPGNVRELRNVVERAVYRWGVDDAPIAEIVFDPFENPWQAPGSIRDDVPAPAPSADLSPPGGQDHARIPAPAVPGDLRAAVEAFERGLLLDALRHHRWNQRRVAAATGLTYDQLRHSIRKHGLHESDASAAMRVVNKDDFE